MIQTRATDPLSLASVGVARTWTAAASRPTTLAQRFADLLLLRPPAASEAAVVRLVRDGMSARDVCLDVLTPALWEVGSRWQRGACTIAQEHLATAVVGSIMTRLTHELGMTPPVRGRVVLACTEGEQHEIGLRMLRDFLTGDGWEVFYVGAETPSDSLELLVRRFHPDVVGLSTTLPNRVPVAKATIAALRSRPVGRPFVLVGGAAYAGDAELARSIGGDAFAATAGEASRLLRGEFGARDASLALPRRAGWAVVGPDLLLAAGDTP